MKKPTSGKKPTRKLSPVHKVGPKGGRATVRDGKVSMEPALNRETQIKVQLSKGEIMLPVWDL